jgi:hypothetical protein
MDLADLLFSPIAPRDFCDRYLGREVLHLPPDDARAAAAAAFLPSLETDAILAATSGVVHAWYRRNNGVQGTAKVQGESAKVLSRDLGVSVYVDAPGELGALEAAVADALGLAREDVVSSMFLNRAGNGTYVHFDRCDTLTVQLSGEKVWRLRANDEVPQPTFNWQGAADAPDDLYLYAHDLRSPSMRGADVVEARLGAGSVLYVPHGFWHETECPTDSVSLHLHLLPPHWADVALALVRTRLLSDPRWRARAYGLRSGSRSSEPTVGWMREALRSACDGLTESAFLPLTIGEDVDSLPEGDFVFRRRLGAGFRVLEKSKEQRHRALFTLKVEGCEGEAEVLLSERQLAALGALTGPDGFAHRGNAAFASEAQLTANEARQLLDVLLEVGFISVG